MSMSLGGVSRDRDDCPACICDAFCAAKSINSISCAMDSKSAFRYSCCDILLSLLSLHFFLAASEIDTILNLGDYFCRYLIFDALKISIRNFFVIVISKFIQSFF